VHDMESVGHDLLQWINATKSTASGAQPTQTNREDTA